MGMKTLYQEVMKKGAAMPLCRNFPFVLPPS